MLLCGVNVPADLFWVPYETHIFINPRHKHRPEITRGLLNSVLFGFLPRINV